MHIDDFLKLVKERRSIRKFKPDPIPDEYVEKIGNKALVEKRILSRSEERLEPLKSSCLLLTRDIQTPIDTEYIDRRQKYLATLAATTWTFARTE